MAVYPGSIATDATLKVAANLIQTTLRVAAAPTDTILFIQSTSGFVGNCLVSIDNEIIAIASTGANNTLNVAAGGRGFDGTAAASHAAGAKVALLIVAWHHNALASEVEAIENFLGPNGQNLAGVAGSGQYWAQNFQFTQQPGVSLVPGNNTITLTPVPAGVNGSDAQHYLYVSGGTGTPEAALITGGSAVAGSPSGQLIINCANGHTGAWTLSSASGGIKEAINACGAQGVVNLPAGALGLYAPLVVPTTVSLRGQGATTDTTLTQSTRLIAQAGVSPALIVADGRGAPSNQGVGVHSGYMLSGQGTGTGLLIGGDPNGVYTPSGWSGSFTRYRDLDVNAFANALELNSGDFVAFYSCVFNGNTRAFLIPASGASGQPIGFYDCLMTVPSGIAVQMDASGYGTASLLYVGGQVSGTISGQYVDWQSFGCHYEPNSANSLIVDLSGTLGGTVKIYGGLLSVHGTAVPAVIRMNGSRYYNLVVEGCTVQCDGGATVPTIIDFESSSGGSLTLADLIITPAGTFTRTYQIGGTQAQNMLLSIRLNYHTAQTSVPAAAAFVFPESNYPNSGAIFISGATLGGAGITSVSGLLNGQSGILYTGNAQTFTAGATIGATFTTTPMVPYTYFFDSVQLHIH